MTNFFSRAKDKSNSWGENRKKASGDVTNLTLDTGAGERYEQREGN